MANITIDGDAYEVPDAEAKGFVEGHVCTLAEARTLFQTYKENVGNNLRKFVKEAKEKGESAAEKVFAYANEYSFAMPSAGGGRKIMDPVEREARSMAREAIKGFLVKEGKGRKIKDIPEDKLEASIEQIIAQNDLLKKAKKVVAARKAAGDETLTEGVDLAA